MAGPFDNLPLRGVKDVYGRRDTYTLIANRLVLSLKPVTDRMVHGIDLFNSY